jgi:ribosomal protein L33
MGEISTSFTYSKKHTNFKTQERMILSKFSADINIEDIPVG